MLVPCRCCVLSKYRKEKATSLHRRWLFHSITMKKLRQELMRSHTRSATTNFLLAPCAAAIVLFAGCQYNVESPCDDRPLKYNESVDLIFSAHCTGCHSGANPSAGLHLDNFENIRDAVLIGDVIDRINRPATDPLAMPPSGSFLQCDASLIQQWTEAGAPE